eukprot:Anaeramoba_ignava/a92596_63.p1 GENE.a92596_63~~a92596_63.p1  ORF type:complete len:267 (+),score=50.91 a92596_63:168-968(+)
MIHELGKLVKLQKVDNQLLEIKKIKGDLPQIVDNLQEEIDILKIRLNKCTDRLKHIAVERDEINLDIKDKKEHQKKYEDQLYLVTSNKEYDALTVEIDTVKQKIDEQDYKLLELDKEEKDLQEKEKIYNLDFEEKDKVLTEKKSELEKREKETQEAGTKFKTEREGIVTGISPRYLREYERIAKARDGKAIVPVNQLYSEKVDKKGNVEYIPGSASCGGCHKNVPAQKLMEIKRESRLIRCEFCGRLLYWDENESDLLPSEEEIII